MEKPNYMTLINRLKGRKEEDGFAVFVKEMAEEFKNAFIHRYTKELHVDNMAYLMPQKWMCLLLLFDIITVGTKEDIMSLANDPISH